MREKKTSQFIDIFNIHSPIHLLHSSLLSHAQTLCRIKAFSLFFSLSSSVWFQCIDNMENCERHEIFFSLWAFWMCRCLCLIVLVNYGKFQWEIFFSKRNMKIDFLLFILLFMKIFKGERERCNACCISLLLQWLSKLRVLLSLWQNKQIFGTLEFVVWENQHINNLNHKKAD